MFEIQEKIQPWKGSKKETGDVVYNKIIKHLDDILLKAYQSLDPSTVSVPQGVLVTERKKFDCVSHGAFSKEYFAEQAKIIADVSRNADFVDYLVSGYAPYASGLVSALVRETRWSGKQRDVLIQSLMNSVFSEPSVVMFYYFDLLNKAAEEERARAEAERGRMAEEDAKVIDILGKALIALANGDLSYQITSDVPEKSEPIRQNFNEALSKLHAAMTRVSNGTASIRAGTMEISAASDDLSRRSEQQAASLEQTAAALNEITATAQSTAESANHARQIVSTTKDEAEHSGVIMQQAEQAMGAIQTSSQQISQIIGVIDEIAFQTNLLALNAGVEAARAGEAGKGFAVVAQEVRELAQRSAEAAKQIKTLIGASEQQVGQGVSLVAQTGSALARIVSRVTEINTIVADIDASSREQSTGIREVNTAINQMDHFTQQNAAKVEETAAAGHQLSREAEQLARLISEFRLGTETTSRPRRENVAIPIRNIA